MFDLCHIYVAMLVGCLPFIAIKSYSIEDPVNVIAVHYKNRGMNKNSAIHDLLGGHNIPNENTARESS